MGIKLNNGRIVDVEYAKVSFWELLSTYVVKIPDLQRDYAYGRDVKHDMIKSDKKNTSDDRTTRIIRESLINGVKDALDNDAYVNLNFIYGVNHGNERYSPIDGQQRLTTLFLLYWYISQREGNNAHLKLLGERFSYATRDTSVRFCKKICSDELTIDFAEKKISDQIEDCSWFAKSFKNDPTVWSMLVVIDTIHHVFANISDSELADYSEKIHGRMCPVKFETLTVTSLGNEEDLYIKMNGRGKQLTDFEIFKSLLQKSDNLRRLLGGNPDSAAISQYIGKFNTAYSQLFNKLIGNPLKVEASLFSFIKNYFMCEYFSKISEAGISEKDYRTKCGEFRFFNGKVLFEFFLSPDYFGLYRDNNLQAPEDINILALEKAEGLLTKMKEYYDSKKTLDVDTKYFKVCDRIVHLNADDRSIGDDYIDYSIFELIYRFDFPSNDEEIEAFRMWKRFVYNISSNVDFKGSNESLIKLIRVTKDIVSSMQGYNVQDVLDAIRQSNNHVLLVNSRLMKPQFDEESNKADLIIEDPDWKQLILDAEDYFTGGQIGFLIYMSTCLQGESATSDFSKMFNASKSVWDSDRKIQQEDYKKITKAFLSVPDNTENNTSHLIKKSTGTYEIPMQNYYEVLRNYTDAAEQTERQAQWDIFVALLEEVIDGRTVNEASDILINRRVDLDYWKECMVANDIFGIDIGCNVTFSNHICFIDNNNDWLLLSKQSVRSKNMSLMTLMLYLEMRSRGFNVQLNAQPTQRILDENNKPIRTVSYNGYNIGYNSESRRYEIVETSTDSETISGIIEEVERLVM